MVKEKNCHTPAPSYVKLLPRSIRKARRKRRNTILLFLPGIRDINEPPALLLSVGFTLPLGRENVKIDPKTGNYDNSKPSYSTPLQAWRRSMTHTSSFSWYDSNVVTSFCLQGYHIVSRQIIFETHHDKAWETSTSTKIEANSISGDSTDLLDCPHYLSPWNVALAIYGTFESLIYLMPKEG